jgi:hypothetical protein
MLSSIERSSAVRPVQYVTNGYAKNHSVRKIVTAVLKRVPAEGKERNTKGIAREVGGGEGEGEGVLKLESKNDKVVVKTKSQLLS